jgi:fructose-1,6-bisphosphatase/inositol monophosphatase family enzyme
MPDPALARSLLPLAASFRRCTRCDPSDLPHRCGFNPQNKDLSGFDPVTEADRASERVMREIITAERPDDAIEGEEYGSTPGTSGLTWYLDPIDGTRAFVAGLPSWCVLIGLVKNGNPILGIIDQPWLDERYVGVGDEAWLDCRGARTKLKTRDCPQLTQAVLSTTDPSS